MEILLLIELVIFGLYISEFSSIALKKQLIGYIMAFSFVYILSGFVTYTPDWVGYETVIQNDLKKDIFFNLVVAKIVTYGYGYEHIHLFFTGMYTFILVYLISRFSNKAYLIVLLYLPIVYLFYTTQIRYFLGYFSMCLAFYLWYVKDKRYLAIIMVIFALMNHISLIIFCPLIYFFYININILTRRVIYVLILIIVIYFTIFSFNFNILKDIKFIGYLTDSSGDSSILGGLFTFLPSILTLYFVHKYSKRKIKQYPDILADINFQFLYRFSIIPLVFLGISLNRQIIGHRFIIPAVLFQILLMFHISKYNTKKQNFTLVTFISLYFSFYLIYIYVLPSIIRSDNINQEVIHMLKSNTIISNFL